MRVFIHFADELRRRLNALAPWFGLLLLRLVIGWEFLEAGLAKYQGQNWFGDVQSRFLFPFNLLPAEFNWNLAMGFELVGGVALIFGLGTRFFAATLIVLTVVATAAVHWPAEWQTIGELLRGYGITDRGHGNFKLPVIFVAMLIPLVLQGGGRLGIDGWVLARWFRPRG